MGVQIQLTIWAFSAFLVEFCILCGALWWFACILMWISINFKGLSKQNQSSTMCVIGPCYFFSRVQKLIYKSTLHLFRIKYSISSIIWVNTCRQQEISKYLRLFCRPCFGSLRSSWYGLHKFVENFQSSGAPGNFQWGRGQVTVEGHSRQSGLLRLLWSSRVVRFFTQTRGVHASKLVEHAVIKDVLKFVYVFLINNKKCQ